ncbi:MAG: hypothetical protein F4X57_06675 [Chloroflexi bacterium]|nr:hypothetical protein [Chloroflexota bacterium]
MEFGDTMISKERNSEKYIEKARELAALVAANTGRINEERKIPTDVSDEIADAGFFRLLMPRNLGGAQLDHPDFLRIVQIFAEADGSVGWSMNQNNVFATNSTRMNDKTREEIYGNPRAVITNGPPMSRSRAVEVDGGFSLSGRWNFSSGSDHATWIAALTPIVSADGSGASAGGAVPREEMRILLIPKAEVDMVNNWQVNGLRGTASWGFEADELFIPKHRTYDPSAAPREDGPVYQIPTSLLFASGFATVALGAARAGLDAAKELANRKVPGNMSAETPLLRDWSTTQRQVGEAEAIWHSARAFLRESAGAVWQSVAAGEPLTMSQRIHMRLASTHANRKAADVVDIAYTLCGSSAIFESNPVQRRFQDVHVINQQVQGRLTHYDTAGRYFMGMEPGTDGLF